MRESVMGGAPPYVILGRGRWATRMRSILAAEGRSVSIIPVTRQASGEAEATYRSRLCEAMAASEAQIAWLCVLPGPHIPLMIEAALDAGLHVVVEKPWQGSQRVTSSLVARAKSQHRLLAVHFEYCLLEEVERWRRDFHPGTGLRFGGHFFLSRPDHTGMPAIDNLGSHLLAIRAYAAPRSGLQEIRCGYEQPDERCIWLEKRLSSIFWQTRSPLFSALWQKWKAESPPGLEFALSVANDATAYR